MMTSTGDGVEQGMFELGPEASMAGPSDLDLALGAAHRFLADERYPAHNELMLELLDKYGLSTPGIDMAVALHDVADHGLINPKDEATNQRAQELMNELWGKVGDTGQLYYALGCALSAGYWEEEVGEAWRHTALDALYADRPSEEKTQLDAAIRGDRTVEISEELLRSAGAYELDTTSLVNAMESQNVEGLIIDGIELMDNLDNPPPDNPASPWRDRIEVLSCYAPALTFFTFKELAADLRGKALEFFFENTPALKKAIELRRVSTRHFKRINGVFTEALSEALSELEQERQEALDAGLEPALGGKIQETSLDVIRGLKTVGSAAKKYSSERYADLDSLPDGVRFRIIVPNAIGGKGAIRLGQKMKDIISTKYGVDKLDEVFIEVKHPHPDEPAEEDYITDPKDSGYKSYHVVLTCYVGDDIVPFEIQTVTADQEWQHTWSKASEVTRKTGSEITPVRLKDMERMGRRSEHLRNKPLNRELIPSTWLDITKAVPNLPSAVNKTYGLVETTAARIMAPHELVEHMASELEGKGLDDDIFLPPSEINLEDFKWMISQIDPALAYDEQIQNALSLLTDQDLPLRRSGEGQLEGHLLPTAFHAAITATLSSRHWDNVDSTRFLSDTITASLLHDMVEDTEGDREEMRVMIRFKFGDKIADIVDALSSDDSIEDSHERRTAYAHQLGENPEALIIKLSDRMQNHISDLVTLATSNPDAKEIERMRKYVKKTLTYLSPLFRSDKVPYEYQQVHQAVMVMAEAVFPELFEQTKTG